MKCAQDFAKGESRAVIGVPSGCFWGVTSPVSRDCGRGLCSAVDVVWGNCRVSEAGWRIMRLERLQGAPGLRYSWIRELEGACLRAFG